MAQTNILLESGTNELEIVEFYLDETSDDTPGTASAGASGEEVGGGYRGYFGVNVAKVLEIIRAPKITEMPEVQHPAVRGAFNQRSHVIPLVDLSMWLGKDRVEKEPPKVIVTEFNNVTTAFMVSGVNRIHRISWEEVEPPNAYIQSMSGNSVTGVVKLENRIIFILDLEKIVADLNPGLALRLDENVVWSAENNYRALVADDSTLIREMLKDLLQKANFIVEAHNNGRDAWERLKAMKASAESEGKDITDFVHVVVSDIEMPQMDGHNLTKRIKTDPVLKKLPVLLFSSLITDKLRHKGDEVGADEQISKPEVTFLAQRAITLIESGESREPMEEGLSGD